MAPRPRSWASLLAEDQVHCPTSLRVPGLLPKVLGQHSLRLGAGLPGGFDHGRSLLAKHQIHHPAAPDMLATTTAVVQDVGIIAAGVFEGIGENWQAIKSTVVVDRRGQGGDVRCSPGRVECELAEGVTEDVTNGRCGQLVAVVSHECVLDNPLGINSLSHAKHSGSVSKFILVGPRPTA